MGGYAQHDGNGPGRLALALVALEKGHYPFKNYRHARAKSVFFPGCNFPSLYPKTCDALRRLLQERCDMGVAYDCCGKPLLEMGRQQQFDGIVKSIGERLSAHGVEEIVCACPNCFYALRGRIPQRVTSVYAVLRELGMGESLVAMDPAQEEPQQAPADGNAVAAFNAAVDEPLSGSAAVDAAAPILFPSCPDRREGLLLDDVLALTGGKLRLPYCAGVEHTRSQDAPSCKRAGDCKGCAVLPCCRQDCGGIIDKDQELLTYCASCTGYFRGAGHANAQHVLVRVLETNEQPDMARSFINRARTKLA